MADPVSYFNRKFQKLSPKQLAAKDDFYANDMEHFSKGGFVDGLLRKYFSRGDFAARWHLFSFWNAKGVDRRSVTLGYSMESGAYATRNDQVLFYGDLPALVFDMEDRRKNEDKPIKHRPAFQTSKKPKPVPDEWESRGYPTMLADTEDYSIHAITSVFGTQHHPFGYTIGARDMIPHIVLPKYVLIFLNAFGPTGELKGQLASYVQGVLQGVGSSLVIVVAQRGTSKPQRTAKVLGLFYVNQ